MTEQPDEQPADHVAEQVDEPVVEQRDEAGAAIEPTAAAATGHPAVDEVLRSLDDLDSRPVEEHVAAFEHAHDGLRRALSDTADEAPRHEG